MLGLVTTVFSCLYLMDSALAISVPTGKTTPIEPAAPEPSTIPVPRSYVVPPAPVQEYSEERPEPPPLDPSYVPVPYDFIEYLAPHGVLLVPMKIKFQKPFSKYEKYPLTATKYQKLIRNENTRRKYYFNLPQQNSIPFN
ncbi:uncharacterized protein LOC112689904 [Sipha flava]|uniref:Uncharacterized protein LOC112689904 n=1 Tax=Sipha flava TaxID=143950 RepID=A0A2S2QH28_9HEMI|nr:uncharacterized protein LOC112689904 [Sipha flava]XP_025419565.1 uncharacterized protein LOC112689904 [Sipha flava]